MGQQDKSIVVTGGAGFIGSCVVRELNNRGVDNILVVDDLREDAKWKNLVGKRFADCIHKTDLFNWLSAHGDSIGSIIHLGACSDTLEEDANYLLENNYRYSRWLAEFAFSRSVRFIYASSAATYGDGSLGFSDCHDTLESFSPLNMYGYSKHLFDLWLYRSGMLNRVTGMKYFNVFGPNEWHKGRMASAIVKMVPQAQKEKKISLFSSCHPEYKDGEQLRDFIYVKDVAAITCDLLDAPPSGIVNVGTGVATSWNSLARAVCKALCIEERIEYIGMPDDLKGKYQYFTEAKTGKLETILQRKPSSYTIDEAVDDYVNQHLITEKRW